MNQNLIENVRLLSAEALKDAERKDRKTLLGRLDPTAASLFTLLSAESWDDEKPSMPAFMEKLTSDKELTRAVNMVRAKTEDWSGAVSEIELRKFFASGYRAFGVGDKPGGFTVFMCRPLKYKRSRTEVEEKEEIRAMFGEGKVSDSMVKELMKNDFFIPKDIDDLEQMTVVACNLLDLFTGKDSIASDGYRYGLSVIETNKNELYNWQQSDRMLPAKFAYLLDRAFQIFLRSLERHAGAPRPILSAARALRGSMCNNIDRAVGGFRMGSYPTLSLPTCMAVAERPKKPPVLPKPAPRAAGGKLDDEPSPPNWWSTNISAGPEWVLPAGKQYGDYFRVGTENLKDWPQFAQHKMGRPRPMCVKYQVLGKCHAACMNAHIKPTEIDRKDHDAVTACLQKIYS